MKYKLLFFVFWMFSISSYAQIREIPSLVKESFAAQYPEAQDPRYEDNLLGIQVKFILNGDKLIARYNNKGVWKETEKATEYDLLSENVKDGFMKSKFADWKVQEAAIVMYPANLERYRILVAKNEVQKRYLYFNKNGRLIRDSITL